MYTKDNIIGVILIHKNGINRYKIISVRPVNQTDYVVVTERLHDRNVIDDGWITVEKINRYIKDGVYERTERAEETNYQIY
jgi:hypothetical protein